MRMFLVGMCDIFLILYLTALADFKPTTSLTVDDYLTLQTAHQRLTDELAEAKSLRERDVANLNQALSAEQTRAKQALSEKEKAEQAKAKSEQDALQALRERTDALKAREAAYAREQEALLAQAKALKGQHQAQAQAAEALAAKAQAEADAKHAIAAKASAAKAQAAMKAKLSQAQSEHKKALSALSKSKQTMAQQAKLVKDTKAALSKVKQESDAMRRAKTAADAQAKQTAQDVAKAKQQLTALRNDQDKRRLELEAQLKRLEAEAQAAKLKAQSAESDKALALRREKEAAQAAALAKAQSEQSARLMQLAQSDAQRQQRLAALAEKRAKIADDLAEEARQYAVQADEGRIRAVQRAQAFAKDIKTMKQESATVYVKSVLPYAQTLRVSFERYRRNGWRRHDGTIRVLPVKIGQHSIVFMPLAHLGIKSDGTLPKHFRLAYEGHSIESLWVSPESPHIAAVVLPGFTGTVIERLPFFEKLDDYMPTLMAVRNTADSAFSDTVRGSDEDFHVFKRDKLNFLSAHQLEFRQLGFRGTGQHGERIRRGDQIVDMAGKFVGIAGDYNRITRLASLKGWRSISLQ